MFQALENYAVPSLLCSLIYGLPDGYYLVGVPDNIGDLFQQAHTAGARIHSDSWGSEAAGDYTADSENADRFVWNHRDMAVTFSAGNSGVDLDDDGVVDAGSLNSPATAKNVISVGASENDRQSHWECDPGLGYTSCAAQGGQNQIFTYGESWPDRYPVNPLRDDPSAGNADQMAAFSSRGPTTDGRIKPDVVAPGTWTLSGYSDRFQQQYDASPNPQNGLYQYDGWGFPIDASYKYMGGTSMAAPLVAGGAAVVRDFYQKTLGHPASAALVKATLINSAVDLLDENNDGVFDNANPIPNIHEGWGRVDLANATDGSHQFDDETSPLSTGIERDLHVSHHQPGPAVQGHAGVDRLSLVCGGRGQSRQRSGSDGRRARRHHVRRQWVRRRMVGGRHRARSPQQRRERLRLCGGARHMDRDGQRLQRAAGPAAVRAGHGCGRRGMDRRSPRCACRLPTRPRPKRDPPAARSPSPAAATRPPR